MIKFELATNALPEQSRYALLDNSRQMNKIRQFTDNKMLKTGFSQVLAKYPKFGSWLCARINACVDTYPKGFWSRILMWYCLPRSARSLSCQVAELISNGYEGADAFRHLPEWLWSVPMSKVCDRKGNTACICPMFNLKYFPDLANIDGYFFSKKKQYGHESYKDYVFPEGMPLCVLGLLGTSKEFSKKIVLLLGERAALKWLIEFYRHCEQTEKIWDKTSGFREGEFERLVYPKDLKYRRFCSVVNISFIVSVLEKRSERLAALEAILLEIASELGQL